MTDRAFVIMAKTITDLAKLRWFIQLGAECDLSLHGVDHACLSTTC
jgi:hypothetical protein